MAAFQTIVFDFDGTLTDVEEEGRGFVEHYPQVMRELLGLSRERFDPLWRAACAAVDEAPEHEGWLSNGRVVASGDCDPYIYCSAAARILMDRLGDRTAAQGEELRSQLYARVYREHTRDVARPGARELLADAAALPGATVYVVTNSRTQAVGAKLDQLGLPFDVLAPGVTPREGRVHLFGDARKFSLEDSHEQPAPGVKAFAAIPDALGPHEPRRPTEPPRPLHPRRGAYYDVLNRIWKATQGAPERTLVVGDLFELDLLLPEQLGCAVHLVTRNAGRPWATAGWMRARIASLPGGGQGDTLLSVRQRLGL